LTAAISPNTATGSVQFFDGATPIGAAVAVASGSAGTSTSTLTQGDHSLKATFTPTDAAAFQASTGPLTYEVNPVPATTTTTSFTVSPSSPVAQGTEVDFDATVTPDAPGSVDFYNGSTLLGSSAVVSGAATFNTTSLPAGSLSLKAAFVPTDATAFGASQSAAQSYTVIAAPVSPTVTVTSTPASPVLTGASVSLVAHLDAPTATGTVQFLDGATAIGSPVTVTGGTATTSTSFTSTGDHSITASYVSDDHSVFLDSVSAPTVITVNPPAQATTTTLAVNPASPAAFGASVNLQATVTPSAAEGTVQFTDGGKALGAAVAVSGGTATLDANTLAAGNHSFAARFTATSAAAFGDSVTASPTPFTVAPQPTSIVLTSDPADLVSVGTPVTFKATLTPANAGGSVEFFDGQTSLGRSSVSADQAKITTTALAEGDHSVTAVFTPAYPLVLTAATSDAVTLTVKAAAIMAPPTSDGQTLTPNQTLHAGDQLTLSAAGFVPGETVAIVLHSTPQTLGTVQADSNGNVTANVTIPSGLPAGKHTLSLVGQADTTSYTFVIAAAAAATSTAAGTDPTAATSAAAADPTAAASSGSSLASTGAKVIPAALAALLLIGGGFLLMGGARRRRSH
ncbi:MAG: Ig-like domain repeat protein, partial [Frankiales bacterium]|nr:Ig-like domain repeat protein [Frankiales bacterium]